MGRKEEEEDHQREAHLWCIMMTNGLLAGPTELRRLSGRLRLRLGQLSSWQHMAGRAKKAHALNLGQQMRAPLGCWCGLFCAQTISSGGAMCTADVLATRRLPQARGRASEREKSRKKPQTLAGRHLSRPLGGACAISALGARRMTQLAAGARLARPLARWAADALTSF